MTTIYVIPDAAKNQSEYVCDSQATIDARPVNKQTGQPCIPDSQCSVGTQTDANTMLASNQQAWLTQQAGLFTVDLQTTVEGGVVWTVVNLSTEPANTDRQYFVLDPTTGQYTEAVGLTAAQAQLATTQQNYLVFSGMNVYITKTSW
jgi:hypothetical protein